jgi:hypothetical protein
MTTLIPRNGARYLDPMDVMKRMQDAFAYVETSEEGAHAQVLAWMNQLSFVEDQGRTAAVDEYLAQLEHFQYAARFVHFSDNVGSDGVLLSMLMVPQQPLIIEGHADDEQTWYLIYRAAATLDYEVFEPEVEAAEPGADFDGDNYGAAAHEEIRGPSPASLRKVPETKDYRALFRQN